MDPQKDLVIEKLELDIETVKTFGGANTSPDGGDPAMEVGEKDGCDCNTCCNCNIWHSYRTANYNCC